MNKILYKMEKLKFKYVSQVKILVNVLQLCVCVFVCACMQLGALHEVLERLQTKRINPWEKKYGQVPSVSLSHTLTHTPYWGCLHCDRCQFKPVVLPVHQFETSDGLIDTECNTNKPQL